MPERLRAPQAGSSEALEAPGQPADESEALDPAQPHSLLPEPVKKPPTADPADPAAQPPVEESASQLPSASQAASALPGPPDRPGPLDNGDAAALTALPPPPPQDPPAHLTSTHSAAASAAQLPSALPGVLDRPPGAAAAMAYGPQHSNHTAPHPPALSHPHPAQQHTNTLGPQEMPAELQQAAPAALDSGSAHDTTVTELGRPHALELAADKPAEAPAALEASAQAQPPVLQPDAAETGQPHGEQPAAA